MPALDRWGTALRRIVPVSVLLLLTGACSSTHHWSRSAPSSTHLKTETREDGRETVYRLYPGRSSAPHIKETETRTTERAYFGTKSKDINAALATSIGATAWKGVYLDGVVAGSPAEAAGLLRGDILRFIGPTEITAQEQVYEIIVGQLTPGEPVTVKIQRWAQSGDDLRLESHELEVVPGTRQVEETTTKAHELSWSKRVQQHTGMQFAEVPASLAADIFGADEEVVVVCGVVSGSPGYLAGFRGGDRVRSVDGLSVSQLRQVEAAVMARAVAEGWPMTKTDRNGGDWGEFAGSSEDDVEFSVDGPLGSYTRRVELVEDVGDDVDFYFPIVLDIESDVSRTEWSFLDFIFQFGANYESTYIASPSRRTESVTTFSMLPFGMFEYRSNPDWTEWTFFWFITFRL